MNTELIAMSFEYCGCDFTGERSTLTKLISLTSTSWHRLGGLLNTEKRTGALDCIQLPRFSSVSCLSPCYHPVSDEAEVECH